MCVEGTTAVKSDIVIKYSYEKSTCTLEMISDSSAQTHHIGMSLGTLLHGGELILLNGQLGSGKTTFTQGLAKGLHITDVISSPTFTLLKEYASQHQLPSHGVDAVDNVAGQSSRVQAEVRRLYHFDLYRLDDPEEIIELGFEDYFYHPGADVCVVEWADKADPLWPAERFALDLKTLDEAKRSLLFIATGARYCELVQQLSEENICDY
jgi:tRNA threonylcarbamoyladenosine biosynthesis protein TsaE